jgi:hypothetical protein
LVQKTMGKNLRKRYGRLTPPEHLYTFVGYKRDEQRSTSISPD